METSTGKGTLYDTVGVLYQNTKDSDADSDPDDENLSPLTKRRRIYKEIAPPIPKYNKKLVYNNTFLPLESPLRQIKSRKILEIKKLDFL